MGGFDWQRGKQREHDRAEEERLQRLGMEHGEPKLSKRKSKHVHPNSMAARKWKRTDSQS